MRARRCSSIRHVRLVAAAVLAALSATSAARATSPLPGEFAARDRWAAAHLNGAQASPAFSFRYGGKPSAELLGGWTQATSSEPVDANREQTTRIWTDPVSGLVVRCVAVSYKDFPVVEWTVWFENKGKTDTPILEDVQALDGSWTGGAGPAVLHHARGSIATPADYEPFATPLSAFAPLSFRGSQGRPTGDHWPYFNLEQGGAGLIVAVGWPGQWAASFRAGDDGAIRVRAGQELVHATLHPGESIRTPLMALQFWGGEIQRSQNLWRRWMIAHGMTRPSGSPPPPRLYASSSQAFGWMRHADEASQLQFIDRYLAEGIRPDAWWMDAGWYILRTEWTDTGTWEVDPRRFPRGLRAIGDHAHEKGLQTLVWFEPERVAPGTWLYDRHPGWLLPRPSGTHGEPAGLRSWSPSSAGFPLVIANLGREPRPQWNFPIPGRTLLLHPGADGEPCVLRWTAAKPGPVAIRAAFRRGDPKATTDVHVLVAGRSILDGRVGDGGREPAVEKTVNVAGGDTIDLVVGSGGDGYNFDSTFVAATIDGHDPIAEFGASANPAGPWSYGQLRPGPAPDVSTFSRFDRDGWADGGGDKLLDMGNAEARRWLLDHVDRLMTDQGIDIYRQDFNIEPLRFWRGADDADRRGITENHHVTGYLAYWDDLLRRRPGLLIDSCASGGRRNDLETMRRAVPLWRSDCNFDAVGDQGMTYGLSPWIPYFGSNTNADDHGGGPSRMIPYFFWSNAAPALICGVDVRDRGLDYKALRTLLARWRELSRFYRDDFYQLTAYSLAPDAWLAWQYHSPERGEGAVQAFRRKDAPGATLVVKLRDLEPDAVYTLSTFDAPAHREAKGRELASGLELTLPDRPAAAVLFYKKK